MPNDRLIFEAPTHEPIACAVPSAEYRVRIAGRGYSAASRQLEGGPDAYRVQLWPQSAASPKLLKEWPGWYG